jgi:multisubunit Na+/H+ antiporter MnhB subunit
MNVAAFGFALDFVFGLLALALAVFALRTRTTYAAVVGFVSFGVLLSMVWFRLGAPDVALTEAAIGGGLTGLLLLNASALLRPTEAAAASERPVAGVRRVALLAATTVAGGLALAVLALPSPAPTLAPLAAAGAPATGLGNPVAATLMAFRATDTLLEKVVLVLAMVGVWSLARDALWAGRPGRRHEADPKGVLVFFARLLLPVGVVFGVFLLFVGADHPGGAFQGGTILAAMFLLAIMARLADTPPTERGWLRFWLVAGPALFVAVGLAGLAFGSGFLSYPEPYAKPIILAIELVKLVTVGVTLALLVAGPPARPGGDAR